MKPLGQPVADENFDFAAAVVVVDSTVVVAVDIAADDADNVAVVLVGVFVVDVESEKVDTFELKH